MTQTSQLLIKAVRGTAEFGELVRLAELVDGDLQAGFNACYTQKWAVRLVADGRVLAEAVGVEPDHAVTALFREVWPGVTVRGRTYVFDLERSKWTVAR